MPDVPDAHLSSLHGLALEIRRDNDVSSLSFCILFYFFFFAKKKLNPTSRGLPRWERCGGRAQQSALLQTPRRGGGSRDPPRHSTPSVQSNPEGGGKTKKTFLLIDFMP